MRRLALKLCLACIRFYQLTISPYIGPRCRFTPSCSEYAMGAFKRHGLIRGFYLTFRRLLRCHPWGASGYDPVPGRQEAGHE